MGASTQLGQIYRGRFRQQICLTRSREKREEREEKSLLSLSTPSLEDDSSATEIEPIHVLCGFA
jgi:hypothetical protein